MSGELWYYTTGGKQMEPVTAAELRQLAGSGFLQPSDLIWKEGMANWVKASTMKNLFPAAAGPARVVVVEPEPEVEAPRKRRAALDDDEDSPRRSRRRSRDDDDDDFGRRIRKPTKGWSGLTIGLVIGGVVFTLLVGVITIALIATRSNSVTRFSVDLGPGMANARTVQLKAGTCYEFRVNSDKMTDVDLFIEDMNGLKLLSDETVGPNSYLQWVPPAAGNYRVRIWNLDPARANRSHIEINDLGNRVAQAPPPLPPMFNPPVPPIPPIMPPIMPPNFRRGELAPMVGKVTTQQIPPLQQGGTWEIRVTYPITKNVQVQVRSVERDVDVDLFIHQLPTNRMIESDIEISPDCQCNFLASQGQTYIFRVRNLGPGMANSTISFTAP